MATIRFARDSDALGLIQLIGDVFLEYPGCILDVEREEPELSAIHTAFERLSGAFWVAEDEPAAGGADTEPGRLIGCVGFALQAASVGELKKLYVARAYRRRGLGSALTEMVEQRARTAGCRRIVLWSDSRFREAHAFYQARGYRATSATRELFDLSNTTELEFVRSLVAD